MESQKLQNLKSVTIKDYKFKRRLLLKPYLAKQFLSFLQEFIGNEVILINTNTGIQIFYYSKKNYSQFIKESMLLYCIKVNQNIELKFTNQNNGTEARKQFKNAVYTFSQYPQLFLAYSKKFIKLKNENTKSKIVISFLNIFFEKTLTTISKNKGVIPFQNKLNLNKIKKLNSEVNQKLLYSLFKDNKLHLN